MAKEKKIKFTVKSDGTPEGTSLVVNGADVTKQFVVRRIYFSAYAPVEVSTYESSLTPQEVYLSWDVEEKDDQGVVKTTTYRLSPSRTILKGLGKGIGDSTELQFDSKEDENTFKTIGDTKKLEDTTEIEDLNKKPEKND